MKNYHWLIIVFAALALSGCSLSNVGQPPEPQIISVPSSKPYRYLKYTAQCDASTISRIKVHNETHWRVKQAEAKAAE